MARSRLRTSLSAAAGAAAAVGLWATAVEPRRLVVRRHTLALPAWPRTLDGLRLGLVADLHAGAPHVGPERVARVADRLTAERPDLIALLGDFVDPEVTGGDFVAPEAVGAALRRASAPLGTYAVLGNHDWYTDGPRVAQALRDAATVLEDDAVAVTRARTPLWLVGLADAETRDPRPHDALAGVPPDAAVIALAHHPDVFPHVPARVALTVSGHTHGGQVNLPVIRRRQIPSRYGDRYSRGHVVEGGRHLFVTSGVGTSRHPIRLGRPPEIVVLTLRAQG